MLKQCYVTMPMGKKQKENGELFDFDVIYRQLIRPAVERVGYQPLRADEFFSNASIMDTNVQLISESEAMIVDITTLNANVMHDLGIRHAFVPTKTLIMGQGETRIPFNISNFFVHRYEGQITDFSQEIERLATRFSQICADSNPNTVYRNARYARLQSEYQLALNEFSLVAPYGKSVFVMTKYPNTDANFQTGNDKKLERVISNVRKAIEENDYVGRLASDRKFHPILWKNIEVYLLGCSKGVAIVENKYAEEVNPNIAMEWGVDACVV